MKDVERWLKKQRMPQASPALDARMDALFAEYAAAPRGLRKPVPLWLSAAACLLCFLGGAALRTVSPEVQTPLPLPATPAAILPVVQEQRPAPLFDWSEASQEQEWLSESPVIVIETTLPARTPRRDV